MVGRVNEDSEKITLRLPKRFLRALDFLVEMDDFPSRSEAVRAAIRDLVYARVELVGDRLKKLMQAWASGLNYYLAAHPNVHPRVLTHFEPWMALSFSEGSIGGDIERVPLTQLQAFYDKRPIAMTQAESGLVFREPQGSNGFAIAPSHTKNGHALLLINPHTSFFFRSELQVTSGEGLNAYGAVTW